MGGDGFEPIPAHEGSVAKVQALPQQTVPAGQFIGEAIATKIFKVC